MSEAKPYNIPKQLVWEAYQRVKANRGAAGVDGVSLAAFEQNLKGNLYKVWNRMSSGSYHPPPMRLVEIPKDNGGTRPLGIPTIADRVAQTVVKMIVEPEVEPRFHPDSYGYRPGRSALDAVGMARKRCWASDWVIDLDIRAFFDRVNHDRLMAAVAARVADRRLLRLIRSFLTAGVLDNGLFEASEEGTPQGGPLSPLLSNLVLDELDRELERRGHRFVRYADDCNIYVRSEKAGRRVMQSVTRFIERRLKLQVNAAKSAVDRPWRRSFLSFTLRNEPELRRCIISRSENRGHGYAKS